ncbi:MAG: hypothetical protein ACXWRE_07195 [Pseudobdellovibrionaceae bacterium]
MNNDVTEVIEEQNIIPAITVEEIQKALCDSAAGASELNDQLKDVFVLSDTSATLRLR